jgi:signal transduction histidine kinase
MRSLRARLFWVWALSLLASLAVGVLLIRIESRSTSAEVDHESDTLISGCEAIADAYSYYASGWAGPVPPDSDTTYRRDLANVVSVALADLQGVRGGIWHTGEGPLAGDPPDSPALAALAADVASDEGPAVRQSATDGATQLIAACPLHGGPQSGLVGWTASRVLSAPGGRELWLGLGVLLVLMLAISGWLTWLVSAWSRHVRDIETALSSYEAGGTTPGLPHLPTTGERELDRIIAALNTASDRLATAQAHAATLSARIATSERMAALGRVAAGVAHEIRNPIAAMRLRAENGLAGDDERRRSALAAVLEQVARLDRLLGELLAMTQRREPAPTSVALDAFLRATAAEQPEGADRITVEAPAARVQLDPAIVGRVLDNLLRNAVQHIAPDGQVRLIGGLSTTAKGEGQLWIVVRDDGPGVPDALRASLFEPFVTGRADGTGLGLAIAREYAEAHGGTLNLIDSPGQGAAFRLELPQLLPNQASPPCRPS